MNYILGLDIGIASVGWAAVALDANDEPCKILDLNARIFEAAEQPKTGASLAAPRREARGSRRRTRRRRHRMERLRHLFAREELISAENIAALFEAPADVYRLRAEGLSRRLDEGEWARVLYHIAKHRGFKSNRKGAASDADEGKVLEAVKENEALLKNYKTVGEMMFRDEKFQTAKRNKGGSYTFCVSRGMLAEEIGALFAAQREQGNPHASEPFENAYSKIFADQRSFDDGPDANSRSPYAGNQIEKMIGTCSLETDSPEKRAAKASYSFMRFSLLQKINHLRLKDAKGEERPLTDEERAAVEALAWKSPSLTYGAIRKALSLPDELRFTDLYYRWDKKPEEIEKKKLPFAAPYHEIRKALDKREKGRIQSLSPDALDAIGYAFTVFKNDAKIEAALSAAGIDGEDAAALMAAGLTFRGFGHISVKACRKLIPHLEKGMTYDKACKEAGYDLQKTGGEKTKLLSGNLDEIREIPNPVVRRAIAQTVKVVNAVIRRYGSPVAVNVELAREMGRTFQERRDMMKSMEDNNAANEKLKDELKGYGVVHPSGLDIVKLKLYKEQGGVCAYSLAAMPIEKVLKDHDYAEVDHILPYSRSFDDSYANKVLVLSKENRDKGNRTPMEYMANMPGRRHDFITWVKSAVRNPRKRDNLLLEKFGEDKEAAWKERHLTDTKYIGSFIANLLRDHLEFAPWLNGKKKQHVLVVNGAVTDYTRKRLGIRKIREDGDLHHAVDAAVIATVTQGNIQKLTDYSKQIERAFVKNRDGRYVNPDTGEVLKKDELIVQMSRHFPEPWPGFRHELEARVSDHPKEMIESLRLPTYTQEEIDGLKPPFVSRMPTRKVRGAAHLETVVSPRLKDEGMIVKKVSLDALKLTKDKEAIENYYAPESDRLLYEALLQRLQAFGGDGKKAFAEPFHKPKADGTPGPVVKKVKVAEKSTLSVPVHHGRGLAANGGMVRVDVFFIPEGKDRGYYLVPVYTSDVVRGELPMRASVQGKSYAEWKVMRDEEFIFSLYPNDLVYIEGKKAIKVNMRKNLKGFSSLPEEKAMAGGFFYYRTTGIAVAQISVIAPDGVYVQESLGVKTLQKFEKWTIDILGGEPHPVQKEKRQDFASVKRDPHTVKSNNDC